jgi:hypothetical protein
MLVEVRFKILNFKGVTSQCTISLKMKNSGNLGKPFGIRFELETAPHSYHSLTFYSSNPHLLTTWLHCLEGYLNQRNFHDLFKAKKKIGKGAFATVYLAERLIDHKMVAIKAFSK